MSLLFVYSLSNKGHGRPGRHQTRPLRATGALTRDEDLEAYLASGQFVASDRKAQNYCEAAMRFNETLTLAAGHPDPRHRSSPTTSQFGQDVLMWRNYFSALTVRNEIGYYVDSGANDATWGSNTWFYDHCLGWKGLCVDAQPKYWRRLRSHRSCKLIKMCIGAEHKNMTWSGTGATGGLNLGPSKRAGAMRVECSPLPSMLQMAAASGQQLIGGRDSMPAEVTFWSLDVEGAELLVLNATLASRLVHVRVVMVEFGHHVYTMEPFMAARGFVKVRQPSRISIDHVYINNRDVDELMPAVLWDPP